MTKFMSFAVMLLLSCSSYASTSQSWQEIEQKAKGQTVYFNAWGGNQEINNYLRWTAQQLKQTYDINFQHVKVSDIAETTTRLLAEKSTAHDHDGSVDMVWINGENFKSMKTNQLLFGPFVEQLPNWKIVDKSLPVESDFTEPTLGFEAPWGVGQLVFIHDTASLNNPPNSFAELLSYAQAHPNRVSYPRPPEFHGTSFLKAALVELSNNDPALAKPVTPQAFAQLTPKLWAYLDNLHKVAWQKGRRFPTSSEHMIQLLDDGQLDLAISFNPNTVFSAQANGTLAPTTVAYAMKSGALTNIHFLAIPWNSNAKEAAMVSINFLLSPEAQSRKGALTIWGDPAVIENKHLTGSARSTQLFTAIAEPNPSWQIALEQEWQKRYGK